MAQQDKSFIIKLTEAVDHNNSLLCVGLDPNPVKYPDHFPPTIDTEALVNWGKNIIDQTAEFVCCYKPNFAFYEQFGPAGLEALRQTIATVPPELSVLLDAKRSDIGSTAAAYARSAFEVLKADAITLNPYLGRDSVEPFVSYPGKMAFVLCYTSNPSAKEIQGFKAKEGRLFEHIIKQGQTWGGVDQIGFVVGATQPQALAQVRGLMPDNSHWILAPGVGAQGGDLGAAMAAGLNKDGGGIIVPISRGIIYAENPRIAARTLNGEINQARQHIKLAQNTTLLQTELIMQLYEMGCIQFGKFTLASGKQSPIYIDLRKISSDPLLLKMTALAYADLLRPLVYNHLAAVPYAALTIGTAISLTTNSSLIYPRKEVKSYGTSKSVEGVFSAGDRVVVIEDLVTSGGSVLKAIDQLKANQLLVSDIAVLIDREQGGREILAQKGYRLHAALRLSEILNTLYEAEQLSAEQVSTVRSYIQQNSAITE